MFVFRRLLSTTIAAFGLTVAAPVIAHDINSPVDPSKPAPFDITKASGSSNGRLITFAMEVAGIAGSIKPKPIGQLKGAKVNAYVWPTNLDPAVVGFDEKSGILALAITAHPDFDDTQLFDENNAGDPANDGKTWHSHWGVLGKEASAAVV